MKTITRYLDKDDNVVDDADDAETVIISEFDGDKLIKETFCSNLSFKIGF